VSSSCAWPPPVPRPTMEWFFSIANVPTLVNHDGRPLRHMRTNAWTKIFTGMRTIQRHTNTTCSTKMSAFAESSLWHTTVTNASDVQNRHRVSEPL
jgi:hypothetical protein